MRIIKLSGLLTNFIKLLSAYGYKTPSYGNHFYFLKIVGRHFICRHVVDEVLMCQTTFFMLPHDQRGKMQDNDFIGNRQDPTEWVGNFQIVEHPDKIVCQVGNMQYISRPSYWEIKVEHMGVNCDLILGGMGKADHTFGPWSNLATTRRAGYDQCCWVEGTITICDREFTLEKGYGGHEILTLWETCRDFLQLRKCTIKLFMQGICFNPSPSA